MSRATRLAWSHIVLTRALFRVVGSPCSSHQVSIHRRLHLLSSCEKHNQSGSGGSGPLKPYNLCIVNIYGSFACSNPRNQHQTFVATLVLPPGNRRESSLRRVLQHSSTNWNEWHCKRNGKSLRLLARVCTASRIFMKCEQIHGCSKGVGCLASDNQRMRHMASRQPKDIHKIRYPPAFVRLLMHCDESAPFSSGMCYIGQSLKT